MNGKHVFDGIFIDRDDGPMIQESVYWALWITMSDVTPIF